MRYPKEEAQVDVTIPFDVLQARDAFTQFHEVPLRTLLGSLPHPPSEDLYRGARAAVMDGLAVGEIESEFIAACLVENSAFPDPTGIGRMIVHYMYEQKTPIPTRAFDVAFANDIVRRQPVWAVASGVPWTEPVLTMHQGERQVVIASADARARYMTGAIASYQSRLQGIVVAVGSDSFLKPLDQFRRSQDVFLSPSSIDLSWALGHRDGRSAFVVIEDAAPNAQAVNVMCDRHSDITVIAGLAHENDELFIGGSRLLTGNNTLTLPSRTPHVLTVWSSGAQYFPLRSGV